MPVMDGYALVVALQSDPTLAAIPRVLLTSEDLDHPLVRRLRLLCQAVVAKPFSMADLDAALQRVLSP